jgi:hypothetical protein
MFKTYNLEISNALSEKEKNTNWKEVLVRHKLMISRIQHERYIHLLVTIFVGICTVLCFLGVVLSQNKLLGFLTLMLIVLFTAYILHYRFLENTTQKWYEFEDQISKNLGSWVY